MAFPFATVIIVLVVSFVAGYAAYELSKDDLDYGDEKQSGVKGNTTSTEEIIPLVYGQRRVGGNIVYLNTSGEDNKILHMILLLAQGECNQIHQEDSVDQIFLDDRVYTEYGTLVNYEFFNGATDQAVCATLQGYFSDWNDPLQDYCYLYLRATFDREYFRGIPKVNVVLQGKKVYDPREGSHDPNDPSTWEYSTNAALAARDFMVNDRYGWGVPVGMINETSIVEVADYFGVTKEWSFNTVYKDDDNAHDILEDILKHTRGSLIYSAGAYYLKYADTNYNPVELDLLYEDDDKTDAERGDYALFDDDSIEIVSPSRFDRANRGIVAWIDASRKDTKDELRLFNEAEYLRDGDYRDHKIELLGCTDKDMAIQLGNYYLERAILNRSISLTAFDEAARLDPHDLVRVTSYELAWTDQLCRVIGQSISFEGTVTLNLIEEDNTLYDDDLNVYPDELYNLNFPDRLAEPPSVPNANVTEELISYRDRRFTRLKVSFTIPDYVWFDYIEAWTSIDAGATWHFYGKVDTDFNIDNVFEGQTYLIALRVVNQWEVRQDPDFDKDTNPVWNNTYVLSAPILGHATQPESLDDLFIIINDNAINIYGDIVDDDDVFVYELRLGGWTGGILLMSNETPNFSFKGVKPGTHEFYANTLSNNGLYGATPQGASVTLPDPPPLWQTDPGYDEENQDYSRGAFENTERVRYDNRWWVKCSHTGASSESSSSSSESSVSSASSEDSSSSSSRSSSSSQSSSVSSSSSESSSSSSSSHSSSSSSSSSESSSSSSSSSSESSSSSSVSSSSSQSSSSSSRSSSASSISSSSSSVSSVSSSSSSSSSESSSSSSSSSESSSSSSQSSSSSESSSSSSSKGPIDELTGTYTSPVYDMGSLLTDEYLAYIRADIVVIGAGNTWDDQVPSPWTWDQARASERTWLEIFALTAAPNVSMKLKYGPAHPPTNEVDKMEILSTVLTGFRYLQLEITITDPSEGINAYVEEFDLVLRRPT